MKKFYTVLTLALVAIVVSMFACIGNHSHAQDAPKASAKAVKSPAPTPDPLAITPQEAALVNPTLNAFREWSPALDEAAKAMRAECDDAAKLKAMGGGQSKWCLAIKPVEEAQAKYKEWEKEVASAHDCVGCKVNLDTGKLERPLTIVSGGSTTAQPKQ